MIRPPPKRKTAAPSDAIPHSFDLKHFDSRLFPNDPKRARWIARIYRNELVAAGAIARVGKSLVIITPKYLRWLERKTVEVGDFQSNNPKMRAATLSVGGEAS